MFQLRELFRNYSLPARAPRVSAGIITSNRTVCIAFYKYIARCTLDGRNLREKYAAPFIGRSSIYVREYKKLT